MNIDGIKIMYLFDSEKNSSLFLDHCHLNKSGSIKWTKEKLLPFILKEGVNNERL